MIRCVLSTDYDDDANDNNGRQTIHDYIGSFMSNEPKIPVAGKDNLMSIKLPICKTSKTGCNIEQSTWNPKTVKIWFVFESQ